MRHGNSDVISTAHIITNIVENKHTVVKLPCQMHHQEHHRDLCLAEENHRQTEQQQADNDLH